jgi:hypothetical protein
MGVAGSAASSDSAQLFAMKFQLATQIESAHEARSATRAMSTEVTAIRRKLANEEDAHRVSRTEMAETCSRIQESLTDEIVRLSRALQDMHDRADETAVKQIQILRERDAVITQRDVTILALHAKMDDLVVEVNGMLSDTLLKMHERVEFTNERDFASFRHPWSSKG